MKLRYIRLLWRATVVIHSFARIICTSTRKNWLFCCQCRQWWFEVSKHLFLVLNNFLMRPENWVYKGTSINKWYELHVYSCLHPCWFKVVGSSGWASDSTRTRDPIFLKERKAKTIIRVWTIKNCFWQFTNFCHLYNIEGTYRYGTLDIWYLIWHKIFLR